MNQFIKNYLTRIGYSGKVEPTLETLKSLHRNHLLSIPFENLDIHYGRPIILKVDALYEKIIQKKRGGFCYELNGLFHELLIQIGFKAKMVSARVAADDGGFGPDFDHLALIVQLDDFWLADVGFGDSFIIPLPMQFNKPQYQYGKYYQLIQSEDGSVRLQKSSDGISYMEQYIFSTTERKLKDFNDMCNYHQTSSESSFTQRRICTIATEDGRITLANSKLIITKNGEKTERNLMNEDDYFFELKRLFDIIKVNIYH